MKYRIPYADAAERQVVLDANTAFFLVGEDNHVDGNFLIFEDIKPEDPEGEFRKLNLASLTPDQVDAYIDTNVTDLASAKTVLKLYGKAILWLAKKNRIV